MNETVLNIPRDVIDKQRSAADPLHSAWVTANAGSGKTHVLSRRVMRLLLNGTDPSRILCLTYTRAAASQMSNRVFGDLGKWTTMPDVDLAAELAELEGGDPRAEKLAEARRLFARALETPGGLKIQTIHAFCEAVLHRFPLEANIAGRFELAEPETAIQLMQEARRWLLSRIASGHEPELADALQSVLEAGKESGFENAISEIINHRNEVTAFTEQFHGDGLRQALLAEYGFVAGDTPDTIAANALPLIHFDEVYVDDLLAAATKANAKTATGFATDINKVFEENPASTFLDFMENLVPRFVTGKFRIGEGKAKSTTNLCVKALAGSFPDLGERFQAEADRLLEILNRIFLLKTIDATAALMKIADAMIRRYDHIKTARGLLDFDDLITKTAELLTRPDAGPWIQYKLDKGIDHILVDEAQDTSPKQWQVIKALALEFFTGESARSEISRTMFAVGDEKQSIYSFQGADPFEFGESKEEFKNQIKAAEKHLEEVTLDYSFRSAADVLSGVDQVFSRGEARKGLTQSKDPVSHLAIKDTLPGFVQLWESIGQEATDEPEDWRQSIDHTTAAEVRLAQAIAKKIERWIADTAASPLSGKPLVPGEIMVLVRKRTRFMHALSRELKGKGIAVAGADRIKLRDHLAVRDMVALGRFLVQPEDDLSLAALLKSPIFALDDDALMAFAIGRGKETSLFRALKSHGAHDDIVQTLQGWKLLADRLSVFDFYTRLLSEDRVRKALVGRLGIEASDLLDEFLNTALSFEQQGGSGLDAFLSRLESSDQEVKREADSKRDEIRIMTVHGSKGLEARLVFVVDTGGAPYHSSHGRKLLPVPSEGGNWHEEGFLWKIGTLKNSVTADWEAELKSLAEDEYRRLLYVAMTRAEEGLVVCGYHGKKDQHDDAWHALVERGLSGEAGYESDPDIGLNILTCSATPKAAPTKERQTTGAQGKRKVPDYLTQKLPATDLPPRPLSPSGVSLVIDDDGADENILASPVVANAEDVSASMQRGTVIHRLLQELPEITDIERETSAFRYLETSLLGSPESERRIVLQSIMDIIGSPDFSDVFAVGSRAEVAVMGTLEIRGRKRAVSGKIDRLSVSDNEVLIVDYKTNRPAPRELGSVPRKYLAQMALYRDLIRPIYPGKSVRAALLFTETPQLIELSDSIMDDALAAIGIS